jgi:hypothetical protein
MKDSGDSDSQTQMSVEIVPGDRKNEMPKSSKRLVDDSSKARKSEHGNLNSTILKGGNNLSFE